jgi:transcriptional regulator with PAS, ATPase and Fis domain
LINTSLPFFLSPLTLYTNLKPKSVSSIIGTEGFAYYIGRNGNARTIEPEALDLLEEHHWPGNVRELVNLTKSMEGFTGRRMIRIGDLPRAIRHSLFSSGGVKVYNNGDRRAVGFKKLELQRKRELILSILERNSGNKAAAARDLAISRKTLYRCLEKSNN